jgi:hypothetical protein
MFSANFGGAGGGVGGGGASGGECKAMIADECGVKGLSWVADGGALSAAPIVSGAYGSRVAARWSAAAADQSAPGPGSTVGSARRPKFGVSKLGCRPRLGKVNG